MDDNEIVKEKNLSIPMRQVVLWLLAIVLMIFSAGFVMGAWLT